MLDRNPHQLIQIRIFERSKLHSRRPAVEPKVLRKAVACLDVAAVHHLDNWGTGSLELEVVNEDHGAMDGSTAPKSAELKCREMRCGNGAHRNAITMPNE